MIAKIHILFKMIDELFTLPYGTSKEVIKERLEIESIAKLDHEEKVYLLRYLDNILLENGYDIEE
jgi:hypothetical protein